jgi:hypothetical protein
MGIRLQAATQATCRGGTTNAPAIGILAPLRYRLLADPAAGPAHPCGESEPRTGLRVLERSSWKGAGFVGGSARCLPNDVDRLAVSRQPLGRARPTCRPDLGSHLPVRCVKDIVATHSRRQQQIRVGRGIWQLAVTDIDGPSGPEKSHRNGASRPVKRGQTCCGRSTSRMIVGWAARSAGKARRKWRRLPILHAIKRESRNSSSRPATLRPPIRSTKRSEWVAISVDFRHVHWKSTSGSAIQSGAKSPNGAILRRRRGSPGTSEAISRPAVLRLCSNGRRVRGRPGLPRLRCPSASCTESPTPSRVSRD